jgi:hypothetical protein
MKPTSVHALRSMYLLRKRKLHVLGDLVMYVIDERVERRWLADICGLKFLPNEPRSMLITAELDDVSRDICQFPASVGLRAASEFFQRYGCQVRHLVLGPGPLGTIIGGAYGGAGM